MEYTFPSNVIQLPIGFRFNPTDEELITYYLSPKFLNPSFSPAAVTDADLNKSEPWELPAMAKMGEREWYFFCVRDRKYPTGLRTNRSTVAGYWKATGKDREILKADILIGMKKTLVFYKGRAPKGEKTNWIMHEYRQLHHDPPTKDEWVLCRVFDKAGGGRKMMVGPMADCSELPPSMEASPNQTDFGESSSHVTCFSDPSPNHIHQAEDLITTRKDDTVVDSQVQVPNSFQMDNNIGWGDLDGDISSVIYNSNNMNMIQNQPYSSAPSAGPNLDDFDSLWNFSN